MKKVKMNAKAKMLVALFTLLLAGAAEARTLRATELSSSLWQRLAAGSAEELVVEFRQGDELPVSFTADGDLIQTSRAGVSYVTVKKNFWLRLQDNKVQLSLDGAAYRPIQDMLSGSVTAGAGSEENGGVANAINVALKAVLK